MNPSRSTRRSSRRIFLFSVALTIASSPMVACGVLIGVTDPELRTKSDDGGAEGSRDAEAGSHPTDAGVGEPPCDASALSTDPENCGECNKSCGGKSCNSGICEGDQTSGALGDIREIVVGGSFLYIVQADGIYRTSKTEATVGKKILKLRGAKLSVDEASTKLYAVGTTNDEGTKAGYSCALPCDEGQWTALTGIESDATSIVPTGAGTAFVIGANRIWILGSGGNPLFPNIKVNENQDKGSRVRKTAKSNQFVWTMDGDTNVYAIEKPSTSYIYKKYACADCNSLGFDAFVQWAGASWEFVFIDNGDVSFGSVVNADKSPEIQIGSTPYKNHDARSLALLDSSNVYVRTPGAIFKCPLPSWGMSGKCTSLASGLADHEVTAMASEGTTFYYANVAKPGTDQATGHIMQGAAR